MAFSFECSALGPSDIDGRGPKLGFTTFKQPPEGAVLSSSMTAPWDLWLTTENTRLVGRLLHNDGMGWAGRMAKATKGKKATVETLAIPHLSPHGKQRAAQINRAANHARALRAHSLRGLAAKRGAHSSTGFHSLLTGGHMPVFVGPEGGVVEHVRTAGVRVLVARGRGALACGW